MELTYRLTRDDYRRCEKFATARVVSQNMRATSWWSYLVSTLLALIALSYAAAQGFIDGRGVVAGFLAYLWGYLGMHTCGRLLQHWLRASAVPDDSPLLVELHLKIDGDGVETRAEIATTKYSWRAFSEISEPAGFILLWLHATHRYLIVPVRAFTTPEARGAFVDFACTHIASAASRPAQA